MTKELKQEYTLRISRANKSELVVILYEMLIDYIDEAKENLDKKDDPAFKESIRRAQACIRELISSIIPGNELSGKLLSLYIYSQKLLGRASIHNTDEELKEVKAIMNKLHEASKEAAKADKSKGLMGNSQAVYAGLTYGKESLIVNVSENTGRGITV